MMDFDKTEIDFVQLVYFVPTLHMMKCFQISCDQIFIKSGKTGSLGNKYKFRNKHHFHSSQLSFFTRDLHFITFSSNYNAFCQQIFFMRPGAHLAELFLKKNIC